ncbi:hypothetical protein DXG01_016925 [Tephrocybe rancida]|nr:hypothetical protein DXG01_016925 [Tephrocybe rancida]
MSTSSSNETMSLAATSAAGSPVLRGIFYFFVAASTVFLVSYLYWVVRIRKSPTEYYVDWVCHDGYDTLMSFFGLPVPHQCLYTLDRQVNHAQSEILENMGAWLLCRSRHSLAKRQAAEEVLQKCGKLEINLQAEWKAQVETQTKPLRETRDGLKKWQREYDALIEDENTPLDEYTEAKTELESVCLHLRDLTTKIHDKQSALGVADRARLEKLLNDPFLTAQMNALALKQCLRDRLCS